MISLASTLFKARYAPTIISFQISAAMIGGALLPASSGLLAEYLGLEIISLSFALQAILLALTYAYIYRYKKTIFSTHIGAFKSLAKKYMNWRIQWLDSLKFYIYGPS